MAQQLQFKTIATPEEAKGAWETLSPHKTIDDEWNFRYAFFEYLNYDLHFIAGYDNEKLIGLLALQRNKLNGLRPPYAKTADTAFLEFFGGDDTDDNTVWVNKGYEECVPQFFEQIHEKAYLAPLAQSFTYKNLTADIYEYKYYLSLSNYKTYEDYLEDKWSRDSRKKIRQQIRNIYRGYPLQIANNDHEDIKVMGELNKKRFGENSSFAYSYREKIFTALIKFYQVEMLTVSANGVKHGVSYGINFKNTYIGMNAGIRYEIEDLGKLLTLLQINRAIELGCALYDAGKGSSGWKESFKFEKVPQFQLILV